MRVIQNDYTKYNKDCKSNQTVFLNRKENPTNKTSKPKKTYIKDSKTTLKSKTTNQNISQAPTLKTPKNTIKPLSLRFFFFSCFKSTLTEAKEHHHKQQWPLVLMVLKIISESPENL